MRTLTLSFAAGAALVLGACGFGRPAAAEGEGSFAVPANDTFRTECSACHMAYPAGMLPARSWTAIMSDLSNHFGEDASLDDAARAEIADWLTANAAPEGSWVARLPASGEQVLRITEMPWWISAHRGEVNPALFNDPRVGSKANCPACHRRLGSGSFEDD